MKLSTNILVSIATALCHCVCVIQAVRAQVPFQLQPAQADSIEMKSDSQQRIGERYQLTGHVQIVYGQMHLSADQVDYDAASGELAASGDIHFSEQGQNENIKAR